MSEPTPAAVPLTLYDLMAMDRHALHDVLCRGHALDPDRLAGRQFLGVDLSLPGWARKVLWHTFRKTFVRDEPGGEVREWNVRMAQHGVDGPRVPMKDRKGRAITFGHYRVRSAEGIDFPRAGRARTFSTTASQGTPFTTSRAWATHPSSP